MGLAVGGMAALLLLGVGLAVSSAIDDYEQTIEEAEAEYAEAEAEYYEDTMMPGDDEDEVTS